MIKWKHEILVESAWVGFEQYMAGIASDGNIGIIDNEDYTIMLSPQGARKLAKWILMHTAEEGEKP